MSPFPHHYHSPLCVCVFHRSHQAEEIGLGCIRLEIRRAEEDINLETQTIVGPDGPLHQTKVDLELIDDPLLDLRPYITFEFHLLRSHDIASRKRRFHMRGGRIFDSQEAGHICADRLIFLLTYHMHMI